jgi:hypothetical protein
MAEAKPAAPAVFRKCRLEQLFIQAGYHNDLLLVKGLFCVVIYIFDGGMMGCDDFPV